MAGEYFCSVKAELLSCFYFLLGINLNKIRIVDQVKRAEV
jgi:hypothetical protein